MDIKVIHGGTMINIKRFSYKYSNVFLEYLLLNLFILISWICKANLVSSILQTFLVMMAKHIVLHSVDEQFLRVNGLKKWKMGNGFFDTWLPLYLLLRGKNREVALEMKNCCLYDVFEFDFGSKVF